MTQLHFNNSMIERVDNFTCSCSLGVLKEKPIERESQKGNVEESNPKFDQRLMENRKTGNTKAGKRKTRKWILRKSRFSSSPTLSATCLYSIPLLFSSLSFLQLLSLSVSLDDSKAIKLAFRYGTDPIRVGFDVHATVSVEAASKEKRSWLWFENLRRWFLTGLGADREKGEVMLGSQSLSCFLFSLSCNCFCVEVEDFSMVICSKNRFLGCSLRNADKGT